MYTHSYTFALVCVLFVIETVNFFPTVFLSLRKSRLKVVALVAHFHLQKRAKSAKRTKPLNMGMRIIE